MWLGCERLAEPYMTLGSIPSIKNKQKLKALVSGHSKYPGALQPLVTSMECGCIVALFELHRQSWAQWHLPLIPVLGS